MIGQIEEFCAQFHRSAIRRPVAKFPLSYAGFKKSRLGCARANPLDDIHNTRKLADVYLDGAKFDRDGLRQRWQKAYQPQ